MKHSSKQKQSLYERVTATILAQIEAGPGQAVMPWHRRAGSAIYVPRNAATSAHYRGMNILMLWMAADSAGYKSGTWATYRQWGAKGGQVRRGERATPIIFYKLCGPPHNLNYVAHADMWRRLRQRRCGLPSAASYATYFEPVIPSRHQRRRITCTTNCSDNRRSSPAIRRAHMRKDANIF
jgi:hypothetical protein